MRTRMAQYCNKIIIRRKLEISNFQKEKILQIGFIIENKSLLLLPSMFEAVTDSVNWNDFLLRSCFREIK